MAKGKKTGGRKKGTANKVTGEVRDQFRRMFEGLSADVETWIRRTAEGNTVPVILKSGDPLLDEKKKPVTVVVGSDPGRAAELVLRLAEFHVPKLARTEITGKDGASVVVEIHKVAAP